MNFFELFKVPRSSSLLVRQVIFEITSTGIKEKQFLNIFDLFLM